MFLGNSRLVEYYVLHMFLIFGKIPASTECPPKVSIFYGEIAIVGVKPLRATFSVIYMDK